MHTFEFVTTPTQLRFPPGGRTSVYQTRRHPAGGALVQDEGAERDRERKDCCAHCTSFCKHCFYALFMHIYIYLSM